MDFIRFPSGFLQFFRKSEFVLSLVPQAELTKLHGYKIRLRLRGKSTKKVKGCNSEDKFLVKLI